MPKPYRLYAASGGGSMIIEAAFAFTKLPLQVRNVEWSDLGWESRALKTMNPLGQVPTLVMPNGTILTESATMILHLADRQKGFALVPAATSPHRASFLRWLVFLAAAVYPTFTYGDVPERWVGTPKDRGAGQVLRASTDANRKVLLKYRGRTPKGMVAEPWDAFWFRRWLHHLSGGLLWRGCPTSLATPAFECENPKGSGLVRILFL